MAGADRGVQTTPLTTQLTEWDDVLIRKKIVTREQCLIAKGLSAEQVAAVLIAEELDSAIDLGKEERHPGEGKSLNELDELEEELDDDSAIAKYREQRIREMKRAAAIERFGEVRNVERSDWMREINEASKEAWVVVHIYQDYLEVCGVIDEALKALAGQRKSVKFCRIKATSASENWPDDRLPAFLVYKDGKLDHQIIGNDFYDPSFSAPISVRSLDELLSARGIFGPSDEDKNTAMRATSLTGVSRSRRRDGHQDSDDDEDDF